MCLFLYTNHVFTYKTPISSTPRVVPNQISPNQSHSSSFPVPSRYRTTYLLAMIVWCVSLLRLLFYINIINFFPFRHCFYYPWFFTALWHVKVVSIPELFKHCVSVSRVIAEPACAILLVWCPSVVTVVCVTSFKCLSRGISYVM